MSNLTNGSAGDDDTSEMVLAVKSIVEGAANFDVARDLFDKEMVLINN